MRKTYSQGASDQIYVIGEVGSTFVKIGVSNDPAHRLMELQVGNPRPLALLACFDHPMAGSLERKLHLHFRKQCQRGEWFRLGSDPIPEIEEAISLLSQVNRVEIEPSTTQDYRRQARESTREYHRVVRHTHRVEVTQRRMEEARILFRRIMSVWGEKERSIGTRELIVRVNGGIEGDWGSNPTSLESAREVSDLLKIFDIKPKMIRQGKVTMRGYIRKDFVRALESHHFQED